MFLPVFFLNEPANGATTIIFHLIAFVSAVLIWKYWAKRLQDFFISKPIHAKVGEQEILDPGMYDSQPAHHEDILEIRGYTASPTTSERFCCKLVFWLVVSCIIFFYILHLKTIDDWFYRMLYWLGRRDWSFFSIFFHLCMCAALFVFIVYFVSIAIIVFYFTVLELPIFAIYKFGIILAHLANRLFH